MTTPIPIESSGRYRVEPTRVIDEQVDLTSLLRQLWQRRIPIVAVTAAAAAIAMALVVVWPVTWRAEATLQAPSAATVQPLEAHRSESEYSAQGVFRSFLIACQSQSFRREFFIQNNLIKFYAHELPHDERERELVTERAFQRFNRNLWIEVPKESQTLGFTAATLDFPDREASSNHLNAFLLMIRQSVKSQLISDLEANSSQQLKVLTAERDNKIKAAQQVKIGELAKLREASRVARLIGLRRGESLATISAKESYLANANPPLYLRGYEYLEAEKQVLEEREADFYFVQDLAPLELEISRLQKKLDRLAIAKSNVEVARIDQLAVTPDTHLSPRGDIVVPAATALAFIAAILFFYIRDFHKLPRAGEGKGLGDFRP